MWCNCCGIAVVVDGICVARDLAVIHPHSVGAAACLVVEAAAISRGTAGGECAVPDGHP